MKASLAKLKAIILYFSDNTNPQYLGKIKLMKLFYYLDFLHVKKYGTPITWDQYYHLEKGPIPSAIMNIISELATDPETSKLADDIEIVRPAGTKMQQVKGLRNFDDNDKSLFGKTELDILEEVCSRFSDDSTEEIVAASHLESPWLKTKYGQAIPYSLAAQDPDSLFSEDDIRFLQKAGR